jgi:hypothetical protein
MIASRSAVMTIGFSIDDRAVLVQELDELADAALIEERVAAPSRSSRIVIVTPAFRNANSRSRCEQRLETEVAVSKISVSGLKVIFVPRFSVVPVMLSSPAFGPAFESVVGEPGRSDRSQGPAIRRAR